MKVILKKEFRPEIKGEIRNSKTARLTWLQSSKVGERANITDLPKWDICPVNSANARLKAFTDVTGSRRNCNCFVQTDLIINQLGKGVIYE